MKAYVICVPGTWETRDAKSPLPPTGMTKLITDMLPERIGEYEVESMSVPYTSGYGDRASYLNSVNNGKNNLRKILTAIQEDQPNALVFLVGYSQGATIAGDIIRDWGVGLEAAASFGGLEIAAYYGLSDPRRNDEDFFVGPYVSGYGITGERGYMGTAEDRVFQFCAPGDIIASSDPATDLFLEASEYTNRFWVGDVASWIGYVFTRLSDPKVQSDLRRNYPGILGFFKFNKKLHRTLDRGLYYITSQVHTKYPSYVVEKNVNGNKTAIKWIADHIEGTVASYGK